MFIQIREGGREKKMEREREGGKERGRKEERGGRREEGRYNFHAQCFSMHSVLTIWSSLSTLQKSCVACEEDKNVVHNLININIVLPGLLKVTIV